MQKEQDTESKTETQAGTASEGAIKRKARTKPNQIVGTESANSKDLEEMRAYVMKTLMNAANGPHLFSTPSLSPRRDSHKPEIGAGTSSQQPAQLLFTPSLSPKLDSNKPEQETTAGTLSQQAAHLLFKPSLSPKLDSNKFQLGAATSSQRPAHLLFTPSLSPKLDFNKPELDAAASSQRLADLLFTPSLSPEPTPKLPGPDLAHIFTPTASPPPVSTPKADPTHGLTPGVTPLPKFASINSSSSTLSGTSSASKLEPPVSSGSWTKRSSIKRPSIKRPAQLSRSCSPTDLPKLPKMSKTFQTPERRMVASSSSSSSAGGSRKKVLSVKKPVISPRRGYTLCAPMDWDDEDRGVSGLGDEANDSRALLPSPGDRDEFRDGDGDEPMDGVRRTASDLLPHASPSKPASERLAARKRIGAMPASKRLAARKRTSMPVSPTKKGDEQLATENAKGKGKGREIMAGNATDRGSSEARPTSRQRSLIPGVERDRLDLSAGWKGKGKEKPVTVKKEFEKGNVKNEEDEEGDDSDIVVVSVVKRE